MNEEKTIDSITKAAIRQAQEKIRHREEGKLRITFIPEATYAKSDIEGLEGIDAKNLEEYDRRVSKAETQVMISHRFSERVPEAIRVNRQLINDIKVGSLQLPNINSELIKKGGVTPESEDEFKKLQDIVSREYRLKPGELEKYPKSVAEEMLKE